ncbi:MAG: ABC transporter permease subunit [Thermomicrobiales bacterium]
MTLDHLTLAGTAILVALVIAIPLGILAARLPRVSTPLLAFLGALYTIPSLAFLACSSRRSGLAGGPPSWCWRCTPRSSWYGTSSPGCGGWTPRRSAARGLGMTRLQEFWRVRWPLALPVMIAGLRTATVTAISLATIAAWIGAGGLRRSCSRSRRTTRTVFSPGAIAITALAILTDALLRFIESRTAIRQAQAAAR